MKTRTRSSKALQAAAAGFCAAGLTALAMRGADGVAPALWFPGLLGWIVLQREGRGGLFAFVAGALLARLLGVGIDGWSLPVEVATTAAEWGALLLLDRSARQRLPRGLLPVAELAPLLLRGWLPAVVLAAALHGGVLYWAEGLSPAAWATLFGAHAIALLLAYLSMLEGPAFSESPAGRRRHSMSLLAVLLLAIGASVGNPVLWLPLLSVIAWQALAANLRGIALSLSVAALVPGLLTWLGSTPPAALAWVPALTLSGFLLTLLAVESAMREASRAQMSMLVHARTEALHAELSRRRDIESRLKDSARYDSLTGAPNRALLLDRLGLALADARRQQHGVAIGWMSLDGLQVINDACGRQVGDQALSVMVERLQRALRGSDTVGRVGGDEFVIIAPRAPTPEAAGEVAMRVLTTLERPIIEDAPQLALGASLGVALYPSHGELPEALLRKAESAMQDVKRCGSSGWMLYAGDGVVGTAEDDAVSESSGDPAEAADFDPNPSAARDSDEEGSAAPAPSTAAERAAQDADWNGAALPDAADSSAKP